MPLVREGWKTLVAAGAVLLVAVGLIACGSDSSTSSTAAQAEGKAQATGNGSGKSSKQKGGGEAKSDSKSGEGGSDGSSGGSDGSSGESGGSSGSGGGGKPDGGNAADFVPKQHKDSGGGSKQYIVKGGDNSVQEFGGEADDAELEAAATVLHNFLDARAEGNWAAACQYMSKEMIKSFEQLATAAKQIDASSCGAIVAGLTNPAAKASMKAEAEKADVGSLRTEGDRSFLIYTAGGDTILVMPMKNEGGNWKVASLTGTPLN